MGHIDRVILLLSDRMGGIRVDGWEAGLGGVLGSESTVANTGLADIVVRLIHYIQ